MTGRILSLFGFARQADQAAGPPLIAYILAVPVALAAGWIIESLTFLVEWGSFGYVSRAWASVICRALGVLCTLLTLHSVYRAVIHGDELSWGGWIRKRMLG